MYGVKAKEAKVNGVTFTTHGRTFLGDFASLRAEAGTTGFKGGGRESGSRAYIKLKDLGFSDAIFRPIEDEEGRVCGAELAVCGDEAIEALIRAMLFLTKVLVEQSLGEAE